MTESSTMYSALHWAKQAEKAVVDCLKNNTTADYAIAVGTDSSAGEAGTAVGNNSGALNYSVSYGYSADAARMYSVSLGVSSQTAGEYATAIGYNAHAMGEHSIQIGYGNNTDPKTMKVALDQNMNVELLNENGDIPAERMMNELIAIGSEAPTSTTEGFLGKLFVDATNQVVYVCVGDSGNVFTWKQITNA